ncbi:hypothetical protein Tco_0496515 [Tanacetum coccineum]
MCTYLKNMEGYKLKDLKFKEFDSIQEMFDKAFKRALEQNKEEVTINGIPLAVKSPNLYKLVKDKYESTRPVEDLDLLLWGDLKTMFEPHVEDEVWRNQQEYKVLYWKLYDSYGVHSLRMQHMQIYMLVEKKYPLGSLKRACTELEQESIKKQKVDEDTETVELQSLMQVIPYEEEVAINAIPLATKPLTIVNWKIHKEGKYLLSNNVQGL